MTVVVHSFVADSSLLDCCDLMMCFWRFELDFCFVFEANPIWYSASLRNQTQRSARYTNGRDWGAASKWARLNCTNLTHFRLIAGRFRWNSCIVTLWVACELLQFAATQQAGMVRAFCRPHAYKFNEQSKMTTALTPQTDVTSEKVTWLMENPRQQSRPAYRK